MHLPILSYHLLHPKFPFYVRQKLLVFLTLGMINTQEFHTNLVFPLDIQSSVASPNTGHSFILLVLLMVSLVLITPSPLYNLF